MRLPIVFQCQCCHAEHQCDPSIPGCTGGSPGRPAVPRQAVRGRPAGQGAGRNGSSARCRPDGLPGLSQVDDTGQNSACLLQTAFHWREKSISKVSLSRFIFRDSSLKLNFSSDYKYFQKQIQCYNISIVM